MDLDGLISLLVGLILFFGLNLMYQQQSTVRQGEKGILMKLAQDALSASEGLDGIFCRHYREAPLPQASVEEILGGLQRYNNAIHSIDAALEESALKSKLDLKAVNQHREDYRAVLTDSPFPGAYDPGAYRQQQRHQLAVREGFVKFMLKLNRL